MATFIDHSALESQSSGEFLAAHVGEITFMCI